MPLFTSPPHFTSGAQWKLLRGKAAIFCWVPLDGKLRVLGGKIVFRRVYFPVGAHLTAAASHTIFDLRPPLMFFLTYPPDRSLTAGQNLCWREVAVSRWMPLMCQFRKKGSQIVFSLLCNLTGTDRATGPITGSGMYCCLPAMTFVASPPDLLLAAVRNLIRGQGQIALRIPLFQ